MEGSEADLEIWGEEVHIPPDALARLPYEREDTARDLTFLRQAADIRDNDGTPYRVGLDEIDSVPHESEPGKFRAKLHSHKKEIVIGGAVLIAIGAGVGVSYALNRTQRKKMR